MTSKPRLSAFAAKEIGMSPSLPDDVVALAGSETEPSAAPSPSPAQQTVPSDLIPISNFTPSDSTVIYNEENLVISLQQNETLVIRGQTVLTVLTGSVWLNGSVLGPNSPSFPVFGAASHALPLLECLNGPCRVKLANLRSGLQNIGTLCPMVKNLWTQTAKETTELLTLPSLTFAVLLAASAPPPVLSVDSAWRSLAEEIRSRSVSEPGNPPSVLFAGPKGSGKSTFGKYLLNDLLNSHETVFYLDIDPGQPEFAPPDSVALVSLSEPIFGPNFSHVRHPGIIKSHYIGSPSPRDQPLRYLALIRDLCRHYATLSELNPAPLIVNTPGWIRGLGLDILSQVLAELCPTCLVYLRPDSETGPSPVEDRADPAFTTVHSLPAVFRGNTPRYPAAVLRGVLALCYFHHTGWSVGPAGYSRFDFTPLLAAPPLRVSYATSCRFGDLSGLSGGAAVFQGDGIDPGDAKSVLDATIVSIYAVEADHFESVVPMAASDAEPAATLPLVAPRLLDSVLDPSASSFLTLAVAHSVNEKEKYVALYVPQPHKFLTDVAQLGSARVMLVRGRTELPIWEAYNSALPPPYVADPRRLPYVSFGAEKRVGANAWRVRRNILRRGQQIG